MTSVSLVACMVSQGQNYVKTDIWLDRNHTIKTTEYQYYDGLGRKSQTTCNANNTTGKYVSTMQTYDCHGQPEQQWLPAAGGITAECLSMSDFETISLSTYHDSHAYIENNYDALGNVTTVDEAGDAWRVADKHTTIVYDTNVYGEVKAYYATTAGSLVKNDYHPAGTLTKVSTTDADGHTAIVYKDFLDRTVLERQTAARADSLDTYYVYDERGQLAYVLSPGYQESGKKAIYGYGYLYDTHGRLTKKTLPQSGYTQYWYDSSGKKTGEQTQMMREQGLRRFFLYEEYGRVAVQGLCSTQQDYASHDVTFSATEEGLFGSGYIVSSQGSVSNPTLEIVNYYDDYGFLDTQLYTSNFSPWFGGFVAYSVGRNTASISRCSGGRLMLTQTYYDYHGLPINYREEFDDGTRLTTATGRSFTGVTQHEDRTMTYKGTTSTFNSDYILADSSDLVTAIEMTVNGSTPVTISSLTYDDLGRVMRNTRGGNAGDVVYDYNLRGWITEIDGKGFHEWLYYTDGNWTPYYSGNISSQYWKVSGENFKRRYWYGYDKFGRMYRALYADMGDTKRDYSEYLSEYKANGNFRRLKRYGKKAQGNYGKIDNLHLYFDYNRLKAVREDALPTNSSTAMEFIGSDTTTNAAIQYGYYDDGSLKWDSNKGIAHILYTPQGYPVRVQFKNGHTTEYVYTSDGRRLRTIHRTAVPNITVAMGDTLHLDATNTLSCDTTEYFGDFVFEDGQLSKYLFDGGYCTFTSATGQPTYHYFTRDHQGNVRAVVNQNGTIEQINHYYPLGGIFADGGTNDSFQKYKYNGKELDRMHGLNFYDYGARQYDPILGRFTQIDPLCEKYYNFHPYAYCKNNPVNAVDQDGRIIRILNNGHYMEYTPGTAHITTDPFASICISMLDHLNKNAAVSEVLKTLSSSLYNYDFSPLTSEGGPGTMQYKYAGLKEYENGGGRFFSGLLLDNKYEQNAKIGAISHELFHGYERELGQNPATVNGEVDAYLFEYNTLMNFGGLKASLGKEGTAIGNLYQSSMWNIILGNSTNLHHDFNNAVNSFLRGSKSNINGIYNNHTISTSYQPLIFGLLPKF